MTFRFRKHKRHDLDYDVKKQYLTTSAGTAEVVKYIFVGRCLLIFLTRQFLIWFMLKKWKCYLADDADEFYLLLSSSQELSFKCWVNLVITPADCW